MCGWGVPAHAVAGFDSPHSSDLVPLLKPNVAGIGEIADGHVRGNVLAAQGILHAAHVAGAKAAAARAARADRQFSANGFHVLVGTRSIASHFSGNDIRDAVERVPTWISAVSVHFSL